METYIVIYELFLVDPDARDDIKITATHSLPFEFEKGCKGLDVFNAICKKLALLYTKGTEEAKRFWQAQHDDGIITYSEYTDIICGYWRFSHIKEINKINP